MAPDRVKLGDALDVELLDGSVLRLRPGQYKKGISFSYVSPPSKPIGGAKRGRKPRPSTVKLRTRLARDARHQGVRPAPEYVKWVMSIDDDISLSVARQVVYRERRAALEASA